MKITDLNKLDNPDKKDIILATQVDTDFSVKVELGDLPVSDPVQAELDTKQDNLVSGTHIKTINNKSIVGSGNINILTTPSIFMATIAVDRYNIAYAQSNFVPFGWDSTLINIDDEYSLSNTPGATFTNSRITVTYSGYYEMYTSIAQYQPSNDSTAYRSNVVCQFLKNGNTYIPGRGKSGYIRADSGHNESSSSITTIAYLEAGDYVEVVIADEGNDPPITSFAQQSIVILKRL
jgi:hypothetical protein